MSFDSDCQDGGNSSGPKAPAAGSIEPSPPRAKSRAPLGARWFRLWLLFGLTLAGAALGLLAWASAIELTPEMLEPSRLASLRVEARDGSLLREALARPDGRAVWVPLTAISPHVVQATIASEDRRFLRHSGVDLLALARAAAQLLSRGRVVSGGSTLTMQLARLLRPAPRRLSSKLREMVLAYGLEQVLTKRQILWQYLNRAPYGNGAFGIEAAARCYFSKPASQLSLAEAALLALLPRSPSILNPFRRREVVIASQRALLGRMAAQGRITKEQLSLALAERLDWDPARRPFRAPHLVEKLLADPLLAGAARLRTTIDLPLQEQVEAAVGHTVSRLRERGLTNAAVLVVDNATAEVLAYVGSADFFAEADSGQVDGTLARRQPGSAIKPFTYAIALEQGMTAATLIADLPVHFRTSDGDYAPRNYDGTFHGPVRLRIALGSSYNIPAVRVTEQIGVERLLERLRRAGMGSLDLGASHYGLGLTLGNGEVTLQELTAAHLALARGGKARPLRFVRSAERPGGLALPLPRGGETRRIFDERAASIVSDILADPVARAPAFGRRTVFDIGFPVAVKTGTSKDFRDNWAVGYTPAVTVGVWAGNFDGRSMRNVSGITGAGPIFAEVMLAASRRRQPGGDFGQALHRDEIRQRAGLATVSVCPLSGERAGPLCPAALDEIVVPGTEPRRSCTFHRMLRIDRRNGLLAGPGCPSREVEERPMVVLPPLYRRWAEEQGLEQPPSSFSPLCPQPTPPALACLARDGDQGEPCQPARGPLPGVQIRFPRDGDRFYLDPDLRRDHQTLPLEADVGPELVPLLHWHINGRRHATVTFPYTARWPIKPGRHVIEAVLPTGEHSQPVQILVR